MKKIRILIIILGLFLLFAARVKADWASFMDAVQSGTAQTINGEANLSWSQSLTVGANKTLVGLRGSNVAQLSGNGLWQAFSISGNKTVRFYDNWRFQQFFSAANGGAVSLSDSIVIFSSVTVTFTDNKANARGGAISVDAAGFLNFERSTVTFKNNLSGDRGGAIYGNSNRTSVYFTSSNVLLFH